MPFLIKNPHLSFITIKLRSKSVSIAPGKSEGPFPDSDLTDEARSKAGQRKIVIINYGPNPPVTKKKSIGRKFAEKKDKKLKDRGDKRDE